MARRKKCRQCGRKAAHPKELYCGACKRDLLAAVFAREDDIAATRTYTYEEDESEPDNLEDAFRDAYLDYLAENADNLGDVSDYFAERIVDE